VLEALAPADWAEFVAKQGPQVVAEMTHQLQVRVVCLNLSINIEFDELMSEQRSTKYHHEGACDSMRLLRGDDPRYYSSIIGPLKQLGSRISVWYALHDQLAPAHHGTQSVVLTLLNKTFFYFVFVLRRRISAFFVS
jgi:hypothetical protein